MMIAVHRRHVWRVRSCILKQAGREGGLVLREMPGPYLISSSCPQHTPPLNSSSHTCARLICCCFAPRSYCAQAKNGRYWIKGVGNTVTSGFKVHSIAYHSAEHCARIHPATCLLMCMYACTYIFAYVLTSVCVQALQLVHTRGSLTLESEVHVIVLAVHRICFVVPVPVRMRSLTALMLRLGARHVSAESS